MSASEPPPASEPTSPAAPQPAPPSAPAPANPAAVAGAAPRRVRREPPRFRRATVDACERLTPRLVRVTLAGPELQGLVTELPAASVRLLVPLPDTGELVMPRWNGNEFLDPGGRRPPIRTFTPLRVDPGRGRLDLEIVVHGTGAASSWAESAQPGDPVAVSGPGRGYAVDPAAPGFLVVGDETALPAMGQLVEALPRGVAVQVHVEVAHPDARLALPDHPGLTVAWHDLAAGAPPGAAMVAAAQEADIPPGTRVWVAGEAAAVQRIRRHLFDERGVPRSQTAVRGYWKHGRSADAGATGDPGGAA